MNSSTTAGADGTAHPTDTAHRAPAPDPTGATLRKAARENFPVAPAFLPPAWRHGLMALYGYARLVDDIGDGDLAPGGSDAALLLGTDPRAARERGEEVPVDPMPPAERLVLLDALEADLDRGLAGRSPRHPLLAALGPVAREHRLPEDSLRALIEANRLDQRVHRYADRAQLLGYCALSADPVGRLVLAVTGTTTPERVRRSDAVCTALQIIEHLQDVAEDRARGRIYLPAEDMRRFRVDPDDLLAPTANASLRALIAVEAEWARGLLAEGVPLVRDTGGRLRLLLAGFVGGGRAALRGLSAARWDVLAGARRAGRRDLASSCLAVLRAASRPPEGPPGAAGGPSDPSGPGPSPDPAPSSPSRNASTTP
ncbi:squalene synthase HpnC [Streptomyces sp. ST2-7A]|uniref:squalene synthase HpnC n=1 Tax=Streptomyces sp. ST2-7A TaxID=2907214 RepID=UPI001F1A9C2F|nr:squalene synthase HpnC [Streptomyces sp. ST2-7A]MCE7081077.1 squalene synthase HpnC [Streptomyces sp. ST2-7A]